MEIFEAEKYSDERWNEFYEKLQETVKIPTRKPLRDYAKTKDSIYDTSWGCFVNYVNDAYKELRAGRSYFIYSVAHIKELVKIFGRDLVCRKYSDYWEVWLIRKTI